MALPHWHICYSKLVTLVISYKPYGTFALAHMLIKINHINQIRETMRHIHIATHVNQH
jgi:L-cystine uptake protein TcyP (sodium:dicarboxylate symporter family)